MFKQSDLCGGRLNEKLKGKGDELLKNIEIKGMRIGEGMPKIIIPLVESTETEIIQKLKSFIGLKYDAVEWRADFFDEVLNFEKVTEVLSEIRNLIPDKIVLFTYRTKKEGGNKEISYEDYCALNKAVAETGDADIIDVEIFLGDEGAERIINNIHSCNVLVVASNHDFHKTPDKKDIISRMCKMQDAGADILKIAVMPQNIEDLLILMSATYEMKEKYTNRPIITMSMGTMGMMSRLAGEIFGSAFTFGAVGETSAPGQIPADQLHTVLSIIHQNIKSKG